MTEQESADHSQSHADYQAIRPFIETQVNQQIKDAIKQYDESQSKVKKWRNSWRSASPITKATFFLTAAITVATVGYAIAAWRTLTVMRSIADASGTQTQRLIEAANQMKNAAWDFKGSAQGIDGNLGNAVNKLNLQAGEIAKQASASRDLADTTKRGIRPYIGVSTIEPFGAYPDSGGTPILTMPVLIHNFGPIVALNVNTTIRTFINGWIEIAPVNPKHFGPMIILPGQGERDVLSFSYPYSYEFKIAGTMIRLCVTSTYEDEAHHKKPYTISQMMIYDAVTPGSAAEWADSGTCPAVYQ